MLYTLRSPETLRAALDASGLSTRALARRITDRHFSVSHQRIGQLRVGSFPHVDAKLARRIERELRVEPGSLFSRKADQPS